MRLLLITLSSSMFFSGCAVSLAPGLSFTGWSNDLRGQSRLQFDSVRLRDPGPLVGTAFVFGHSFSDDPASPLQLHSARFRLGYTWRSSDSSFSFALAPELGFGEPVSRDMSGRALFTGCTADFFHSVISTSGPPRHHYYLAKFDFGLFVQLGAGVWAPPATLGSTELFEWEAQLGVRLSFGTDLIATVKDR